MAQYAPVLQLYSYVFWEVSCIERLSSQNDSNQF